MPSAAATAQLSNPVRVPAAVDSPARGPPGARCARPTCCRAGGQDQKRCGDCELHQGGLHPTMVNSPGPGRHAFSHQARSSTGCKAARAPSYCVRMKIWPADFGRSSTSG